jgi:hypothetical protein
MQDDGRDRGHEPRAATAAGGRANEAGGGSFGEVEQPGRGHPAPGSGLEEANEQAGEGAPAPTSREPGQRVQTEDEPDGR